MSALDKLKSLAGTSPFVKDVKTFIADEFAGNERANSKLTKSTALLDSMNRSSSLKLRDAIASVMVQDDSGILSRQSVLAQTVGELIGLGNRIDIAQLNADQDLAIANITQGNQYDIARLKGSLNVEIAGVDGEIDLEIAGVIAASKADIATRVGDAEHQGKVSIEKQQSLNNIALANVKKDNAVKVGLIKGESILSIAVIDAETIAKESDIDVKGVISAGAVQVHGMNVERQYDANLIVMQADNEKKLRDSALTTEKVSIEMLSKSNVSLTNTMAITEKGAIEISSATKSKSIIALANNESKTIITMANAESASTAALSAAEIAAIKANAKIDAGFVKSSADIEAGALVSLANSKKSNLMSEASSDVTYLTSKGIMSREAISSDFSLSDSTAKSLSDLEVKNINSLSATEVGNVRKLSLDKLAAMDSANAAKTGFIRDIAAAKSTAIKGAADTRYTFVKEAADTDYVNKKSFFNDVEKANMNAVSSQILAGDENYSKSRIAKQSIIDTTEVSEITKTKEDDIAFGNRMSTIETAGISELAKIEVDAINAAAKARYDFTLSQSKTRRDNDKLVSDNVVIPAIKALSDLKIKEYGDRAASEKLKYDALTPEMVRTINAERDARVQSIGADSTARAKSAKDLADKKVAAEEKDSNARIDLTGKFNTYVRNLQLLTKDGVSALAIEAAFYAAHTVQLNQTYKNGTPEPETPPITFGSFGFEPIPDFK